MTTIKLPTGTFEYDPTKPLGKAGGFGQVFLGRCQDGEEIAVKKLHLSAASAAHRELNIADELKGRSFQHVVRFIDAGEDADTGEYYVVMPRAECSLQDSISKKGPVSPVEAAAILLQIVNGLIEVGELVHRDLKPDNVLLHDTKWKIADFGIARFVEEATASNTLKNCLSPFYAAPEQWRFERSTHATDIYALGCIAFCLLAGTPPFTKDPKKGHQNASVPSFKCSDARLTTLVQMCLRKVPSSRPSLKRVQELLSDIRSRPESSGLPTALDVMARVAADVASKEQESQARQADERILREEREELAGVAREILADNLERLWGVIRLSAPNAMRSPPSPQSAFECNIGGGTLRVDKFSTNFANRGLFRFSQWDVVTFTQIRVAQKIPKYVWSASLWFAKLPKKEDYRWYEASYWTIQQKTFQPHASLDVHFRDADMAAGNVVCDTNIAFGPTTIDDEKESEFHNRWIWLLAQAARGALRQPSRMPFKWPPQI